jgi:hypothetical protein
VGRLPAVRDNISPFKKQKESEDFKQNDNEILIKKLVDAD